jgi:hypothetical protein
MTVTVDRRRALAFRLRRHGLVGDGGGDLLDYGVQDTGADGSAWALRLRGIDEAHLVMAWTLRGAPHVYRRADVADVALATSPWTEADAAKRIFDASKPLKDAGIPVLEGLATVAAAMRTIVSKPMVKGEVSTRLTEVLPAPMVRKCVPCKTTHAWEQPFRLSALQAGLELEPDTSPPVLRRVTGLKPLGWGRSGRDAPPAFDVVRNHLRFYGPADPKAVSGYLDMPVKDVQAAWPEDAVDVEVEGDGLARSVLAEDVDALTGAEKAPPGVLLLGAFDPYLQLRDRELLVPDAKARKDLWRVIGRPGGLLVDGEVVGSWRANKKGQAITVTITPWSKLTKVAHQRAEAAAADLAAFRELDLAEVAWADA